MHAERMSNRVRASHILLMYKGSDRSSNDRSKQDAAAEIRAIAQQIAGGKDFAELAKEHSDCPSASAGGDLGEFGRGSMVKPFEEAAFNMPVGQVSDVVETQFGYHLILRTG